MPKITFTISDENNVQLETIRKEFGLAKSDSVRRGIELLHDYLINNIQPDDAKASKVARAAKEESSG